MERKSIVKELIAHTESDHETWYACHYYQGDTEDGTGSSDPEAAAEIALTSGACEIALIDADDDFCYSILEITKED